MAGPDAITALPCNSRMPKGVWIGSAQIMGSGCLLFYNELSVVHINSEDKSAIVAILHVERPLVPICRIPVFRKLGYRHSQAWTPLYFKTLPHFHNRPRIDRRNGLTNIGLATRHFIIIRRVGSAAQREWHRFRMSCRSHNHVS